MSVIPISMARLTLTLAHEFYDGGYSRPRQSVDIPPCGEE